MGNKVVSYYSGASGILPELCEGRLEIVHDRDVHSFVERCLKLSNMDIKNDHMEFYMKYNWDNIGNELKIFLLKHVM